MERCPKGRLLLQLQLQNATRNRIIADAGGEGAVLKISARKLDALGYTQGHCGHMTHPERMKKVRDHLALSSSVAAIQRFEQERAGKKREEDSQMTRHPPPPGLSSRCMMSAMISKLRVRRTSASKASKAHLAALLRKVHHITIQSSKSKPEHIKCLAKEMSNDNGAKLQGYDDSLPAAAAGDGDHNDGDRDGQIGSEEEGDDDGPDYGEKHCEKPLAKYHVVRKWNLTRTMLLFMGPMKEAKLKI